MFKSYSYLDQIKHRLLVHSHNSITRHDLQKHVNLHVLVHKCNWENETHIFSQNMIKFLQKNETEFISKMISMHKYHPYISVIAVHVTLCIEVRKI